jgi:hypothetical protein
VPCARAALPPPAFETIPDPINDVADIERLIGALAGAQRPQVLAELCAASSSDLRTTFFFTVARPPQAS